MTLFSTTLRAVRRPAIRTVASLPTTCRARHAPHLPPSPLRLPTALRSPPLRAAVPVRPLHTTAPRPRRQSWGYPRPGEPGHEEYVAARLQGARPLVRPDFEFADLLGGRRYVRYWGWACGLAAVAFFCWNLEQVPVTGRWRFNYKGDMRSSWFEKEFTKVVEEARARGEMLPEHHRLTRRVRRVLERLIPVSGLKDYDWEVYVAKDGSPNAFVVPGGKVIITTAMFNFLHNDDELAMILGHEIAHCVAQHHGERMSFALGPQLVLLSSSIYVASRVFERVKARNRAAGVAVGVGVGVVFVAAQFTYLLGSWLSDVLLALPMSRDQETEADYIGLMLMAEACFDPRAALAVWPRLDRAEQGMMEAMGAPRGVRMPEWASTHPASLNRLEKLRRWMPAAEEKLQQSDCHGTGSFAGQFVEALRAGWAGTGQIDLPR